MIQRKHNHQFALVVFSLGLLLSGCGGQEELTEEFSPPDLLNPPDDTIINDPDQTDPDTLNPDASSKWDTNKWDNLTWS